MTAKKIWNDNNNKNGKRPKTIEFTLYETYKDKDGKDKTEAVTEDDLGNEIKPEEVTEGEDKTWTVTWSNLAVYKKGLVGSKITYSVKETKINGIDIDKYYGYDVDEDGMDVTNTPVETSLEVRKEWEDTEELAAKVTAVTFRIESSIDGSNWTTETVDGKERNLTIERKPGETMGTATIEGLDAYDADNNPLTYRAVEISITVDGQILEVKDGKVGGYNVTETHTAGEDESIKKATAKDLSEIRNTLIRGKLAVEKEWTDEDNKNKVRPDSITITLKAEVDGKEINGIVKSTTLNADNDWSDTTTWADLPVYDAAGTEISYTLTEPTTGTYKAYVAVNDGEEKEGNQAASSINPDQVTKISFRNELIPTDFHVEKTFDDDYTDSNRGIKAVTVKLQRKSGDGDWTDVQNPPEAKSLDLTAANEWKYTWKGLPKFDEQGNAYHYRAVEVSYTTTGNTVVSVQIDDDVTSGTAGAYAYSSRTEGSADNGFTTYINNELLRGSIIVTKQWKKGKGSKVPSSLTIRLTAYANGEKISLPGVETSTTLNESNDWTDDTTWADLPVYTTDGSKIIYHLTESGKGDYGASYKIKYDGTVIKEGKGKTLKTRIYPDDTVKATFINKLPSKGKSAKTGDNSPILPYLTLCLASLLGMTLLFFRRRRTV